MEGVVKLCAPPLPASRRAVVAGGDSPSPAAGLAPASFPPQARIESRRDGPCALNLDDLTLR